MVFIPAVAALLFGTSAVQAQDSISITVIPALAPNVFGSPNWNAWVSNATTAIRSGYTSFGDSTSPGFYQRAPGIISVTNNIVTGFPSWDGLADPGTVFGVPYAQELGNRLQFGVDIKGGGTNLISISQLSFAAHSTDPDNTLDFSNPEGAYSYSASYVGIIYGEGGNDTYITSGPSTQLVNEIVGRGSGNAWAVYDSTGDIASQQSNMVLSAAQIATQPFSFSATYSLGGVSGSNTVMLTPVGAAMPAQGGISITVVPASAPNTYGSPNWNAWVSNATTAIRNGDTSFGDPTSPSFYQQAPAVISVTNNIVTGFPSWDGLADPGAVFGAAYAQELGNRIEFGIDIKGGTNLISLSQLSFTEHSTDPGNTLDYTFPQGSYNYSASYVGIIYGQGGNDIYVTNGPATQLVNEIVGRGSGNAWDTYDSTGNIAIQQSNIMSLASQIAAQPFSFSGTYSLGGVSGSNAITFTPVMSSELAQGGISITVIPALAPNAFGSPNWDAWVSNATTAIFNGDMSFGDSNSPSYYQQAPAVISVTNNIVTGFPSWDGLANPGAVFGAAYAQELGNRLQFGIDVKGGTNWISISQLSFTAHSTDPGNTLDFSNPEGVYSYSSSYVGIIYGEDGNDIYITNGPSTQLVNEIVGRGSGNAWDTYDSTGNIAIQQSNIVSAASQIATQSFSFGATYSLGGVSGSNAVTFTPVSGGQSTSITPPPLTITLIDPNTVSVTWGNALGAFTLQTNSDITTPNWGDYNGPVTLSGGINGATFPIAPGSLFFKLRP